jgi:hypothetical protein
VVFGFGGTVIVPLSGGGVSLNLGLNLDGWNSSVYLQGQANGGAPTAGGYFVGAGGNFQFADADAPKTGFDSQPYWEADAGVLGGLGTFGSAGVNATAKGEPSLRPPHRTKVEIAAIIRTTNTATVVSPTLGDVMSAFNSFAPDGGI